jgi:hypothetical protein
MHASIPIRTEVLSRCKSLHGRHRMVTVQQENYANSDVEQSLPTWFKDIHPTLKSLGLLRFRPKLRARNTYVEALLLESGSVGHDPAEVERLPPLRREGVTPHRWRRHRGRLPLCGQHRARRG